MPLTETAIHKAKLKEKTYDLIDERGLSLVIKPKGDKWWRFEYRFDKKEKQVSLGMYPDVSLKHARELRDEARRRVDAGIDHGKQRPVFENFVDSDLLQLAKSGNRKAICEMAGRAVDHLQAMAKRCITGNDDITPYLISLLEGIAAGGEPNKAFHWKLGNTEEDQKLKDNLKKMGRSVLSKNTDFRDWSLALSVVELLKKNEGMTDLEAITIVHKDVRSYYADEENNGKGSLTEQAYLKWRSSIKANPNDIPDAIFPISKGNVKEVTDYLSLSSTESK